MLRQLASSLFSISNSFHFFSLPSFTFLPYTHIFLSILILLFGDIYMNSDYSFAKFNTFTINVRALTNPIHYIALFDLADTYNIDSFP
jgi:hypothetical protein